MKQLLRHQPAERLPMRIGGTRNIKTHRWYDGFNWDDLFNRRMAPPYKPDVNGPTDIKNFKVNESDLPPQIPYRADGTNWDADF